MTGLHIVEKKLKHGPRFYVYAWRGGPQIHICDGAPPAIGEGILAAQIRAKDAHRGISTDDIDALIGDYEDTPEYKKLEKSTLKDYRLWLTRISQRFGDMPLEIFEDRRMRGDIIAWRNEWSKQPRTADKASHMMSALLGFGVENGRLAINVAAKIRQLHSVNKADEIWESRHFRAMANCPAQLRNALKLALLTGLRLGDLIRLQWENVGPQSIVLTTRKRKGRAVIPILPSLRHFLDRLKGERERGPVLVNSRGRPWTESGLGSVFQKAKPAGFDRRIHDLRGTYVTWLATKGLTDEEIARIVGWTAKRVGEIRGRYVDEARVVVSLIERLSA